jgi:hypothetical protein
VHFFTDKGKHRGTESLSAIIRIFGMWEEHPMSDDRWALLFT